MDVKRLPLGTVEAFLLSHIDGRKIAGLSLIETMRLAARLVELGAIAAAETRKCSAPPAAAAAAKARG